MDKTMEMSTRNYERRILIKMSERLKMVKWGENCDSLWEALIFAENWLAEGISSFEELQEFRSYLVSEGFTMKVERICGNEKVTWRFPSKPKNAILSKIYLDFSKSYSAVVNMLKNQAYEDVIQFAESEERSKTYGIENTLYKKEILAVLGQYNQLLTRSKNTLSEDETLDYIDYCLNKGENALLITKEREFEGFDKDTVESKNAYWIELTGGTHGILVKNILNCFLWTIDSMVSCRAFSKVYTKYIMGVAPNLADEFKAILKPYGIEVTKMPQHPEADYHIAKNVSEYEIPLYIEVLKVNPQSTNYPVNELQAFYKAFKN